MDASDSFDFLADRLRDLDAQHRRRTLTPRGAQGAHIVDPDGTKRVNFGGNDYLGFATQRRSPDDSQSPSHRLPAGSQASALVCGWSEKHQQLAEVIADVESTQSAVVFPSGYAACSGTIATLAESGDLILSDELNHASLIDGCRLSRADVIVYPHRDVDAVEQILQQQRGQFNRVWILTDGVFSMDGHIAPLPELCRLGEAFDSHLIVDEAHGTGLLGSQGSGVCEALNVKTRVAIRIGTLSKAIGSQGGFVCGPSVVIDYLINRCRSLIYSTALAPAAVQASLDAFERIQHSAVEREQVAALSRHLRKRLDIATNDLESGVPIVPIGMGSDARAMAASETLHESGFYVPAIRPPTVPDGSARLRVSLSASHTQAMVDGLVDVLQTRVKLF